MNSFVSPSNHTDDSPCMSRAFQRLHNDLWGKKDNKQVLDSVFKVMTLEDLGVPQDSLEADPEWDFSRKPGKYLVMDLRSYAPICAETHGRVFIRDEYTAAYKFIHDWELRDDSDRSLSAGCVVSGHPGIVKRLLLAKPTVWMHDLDSDFLFFDCNRKSPRSFTGLNQTDVEKMIHNARCTPNRWYNARPWILVDSKTEMNQYPPDYAGSKLHGSEFFGVYTTSPDESRWKGFKKYGRAEPFWMHPWSWEEICVASAMNLGEGVNASLIDYDQLFQFFRNFGPSARQCFASMNSPKGQAQFHADYQLKVESIVDQMENYNRLGGQSISGPLDVTPGSISQSHMLFLVQPFISIDCPEARRSRACWRPHSSFIFGLIAKRLQELDAKAIAC